MNIEPCPKCKNPAKESIIKKLSEIRRDEWIAYRWEEVTEVQDAEPRFLRGISRNPDDAKEAAENWDISRAAHLSVTAREET